MFCFYKVLNFCCSPRCCLVSLGIQLTPINLILCQSGESSLQMKHSQNQKACTLTFFSWDTCKLLLGKVVGTIKHRRQKSWKKVGGKSAKKIGITEALQKITYICDYFYPDVPPQLWPCLKSERKLFGWHFTLVENCGDFPEDKTIETIKWIS